MNNTASLSLRKFITQHISLVSEKYKDACLTYFNAITSGKEEDYNSATEANIQLSKIYANRNDFANIRAFMDMEEIEDPLLRRELEMLFLAYQGKQVDEKKLEALIELQNKIESKFATFRADVDGKQCTDNQIEEILSTSTDSEEVKNVWLASKTIGGIVATDVINIVKMRNDIAQELWYENYHTMSLQLDEQDPEEISRLFDELDILTRDAFIREKESIDTYLANKFHIQEQDLMPWHYQNRYFQEAPKIYTTDIDTYYKDQDIVELSIKYYASIWLPVESILANSDLYEREGKYQHACCIHIDKMGDVRIVCNIKPNTKRMNTQLHELGHAVYDKYLDENTPYLLRDPAHTFTTEAIAMLFWRFASNPQRIKDMIWISENEKQKIADACFRTLRLEQLVSSRWMQVMYRFEKSMYANPEQDLNTLRWDLVEKYQMMKHPMHRDEADRASKIHIACYPCYYHNYQLGELLASQIYYHIVSKVLNSSEYAFQSFYDKPEVGTYLKEKIFHAGRKHHRNTMIKSATGEELTPKYFAQQFVQ